MIEFFVQKLRVSKTASDVTGGPTTKPSARERIILRAAKELKDGMFVNLGIGIPVLAANHSPKGVNICLHGENGIMGLVRTLRCYNLITRQNQKQEQKLFKRAQTKGLRPMHIPN